MSFVKGGLELDQTDGPDGSAEGDVGEAIQTVWSVTDPPGVEDRPRGIEPPGEGSVGGPYRREPAGEGLGHSLILAYRTVARFGGPGRGQAVASGRLETEHPGWKGLDASDRIVLCFATVGERIRRRRGLVAILSLVMIAGACSSPGAGRLPHEQGGRNGGRLPRSGVVGRMCPPGLGLGRRAAPEHHGRRGSAVVSAHDSVVAPRSTAPRRRRPPRTLGKRHPGGNHDSVQRAGTGRRVHRRLPARHGKSCRVGHRSGHRRAHQPRRRFHERPARQARNPSVRGQIAHLRHRTVRRRPVHLASRVRHGRSVRRLRPRGRDRHARALPAESRRGHRGVPRDRRPDPAFQRRHPGDDTTADRSPRLRLPRQYPSLGSEGRL